MRGFIEEPISSFRQTNSDDEDVFQTMMLNKNILSPIRFDCGTSDHLIEHNRLLARRLAEAEIPHIYEEFDGAHEWSYWQEHLADTLKFFYSAIAVIRIIFLCKRNFYSVVESFHKHKRLWIT